VKATSVDISRISSLCIGDGPRLALSTCLPSLYGLELSSVVDLLVWLSIFSMCLHYVLYWSQVSVFHFNFFGTGSFHLVQGVSPRLASTRGIEATLVALDFLSNTTLGTPREYCVLHSRIRPRSFFESMIDNRSVKDRDIPTSLRLGRTRYYRSVDTRVARGLDIYRAGESTFPHRPGAVFHIRPKTNPLLMNGRARRQTRSSS